MKFRKTPHPTPPSPSTPPGHPGTLLAGGAVKPAQASRAAAAAARRRARRLNFRGQQARHPVTSLMLPSLRISRYFFPTYETSDAVIGVNGLVSSLIVV